MTDVLIVEDDSDIRNLLGDQLQDKGCPVWRASNGENALRRLSDEIPDLIFIDIMMPVMDGIGLISELQKAGEPRISRWCYLPPSAPPMSRCGPSSWVLSTA